MDALPLARMLRQFARTRAGMDALAIRSHERNRQKADVGCTFAPKTPNFVQNLQREISKKHVNKNAGRMLVFTGCASADVTGPDEGPVKNPRLCNTMGDAAILPCAAVAGCFRLATPIVAVWQHFPDAAISLAPLSIWLHCRQLFLDRGLAVWAPGLCSAARAAVEAASGTTTAAKSRRGNHQNRSWIFDHEDDTAENDKKQVENLQQERWHLQHFCA